MSWSERDTYQEYFYDDLERECEINSSDIVGFIESIDNIEDVLYNYFEDAINASDEEYEFEDLLDLFCNKLCHIFSKTVMRRVITSFDDIDGINYISTLKKLKINEDAYGIIEGKEEDILAVLNEKIKTVYNKNVNEYHKLFG